MNDDRNAAPPPPASSPPATGTLPAPAPAPAPAADAARTSQDTQSPGSDPPDRSGHPAARRAGEGAPAVEPADPSEIDRSTDA